MRSLSPFDTSMIDPKLLSASGCAHPPSSPTPPPSSPPQAPSDVLTPPSSPVPPSLTPLPPVNPPVTSRPGPQSAQFAFPMEMTPREGQPRSGPLDGLAVPGESPTIEPTCPASAAPPTQTTETTQVIRSVRLIVRPPAPASLVPKPRDNNKKRPRAATGSEHPEIHAPSTGADRRGSRARKPTGSKEVVPLTVSQLAQEEAAVQKKTSCVYSLLQRFLMLMLSSVQ